MSAHAAYESHSYAYVQGNLLLDYAASDGRYNLWKVAQPPRPGCPGVEWPPAASGTLAVRRHALAAVPAAASGAFGLLDYDPANGDFRLGACNRSDTLAAGHLTCHTSANGTWHTGGLQLLWIGDATVLRYSRATGQYTLWRYHASASRAVGGAAAAAAAAFDASPIGAGVLLRADGKRLMDATLTYLDAGELLAYAPSSGHIGLYRRGLVASALSADTWSLAPEEGAAPSDGFERRWEAQGVLRGWQFAYVGARTLMMLKPATGSYRLLNCSPCMAPPPSCLPRPPPPAPPAARRAHYWSRATADAVAVRAQPRALPAGATVRLVRGVADMRARQRGGRVQRRVQRRPALIRCQRLAQLPRRRRGWRGERDRRSCRGRRGRRRRVPGPTGLRSVHRACRLRMVHCRRRHVHPRH